MTISIYDPAPEIGRLREEIDAAMANVLDHGQFILGPEVEKFEREAAKYLGVKHAVGVNSGTDALVIALRALKIGRGDEVITTAMSFFATAESISQVGAKPVFVDVDPATCNINPGKIEAAITPKTKAIIPVHLFGRPAPMTQIMSIAAKHDLRVIEDCAQSFGAAYAGSCLGCEGKNCLDDERKKWMGEKTGSIGDCGTFSFFPTKNLGGMGDGGLITTNDDRMARRAQMLRVHGADQKYQNEMLGYNSRLDTLQAAILGVKLPHLDEYNAGRRQVAKRYHEQLKDIDALQRPAITDGHIFHQYTVQVMDGRRDELRDFLKAEGVQSNVYFPVPQNELPVYDGEILPVAHKLSRRVLSLPMGPYLPAETQDSVAAKIIDFFS